MFFSLLTSVLVSNVGTHLSEIEHFCIQAPWKFKNKANQKSSVSHCFTALWSYVAIWLNMETLNDAENTILLSPNASHNICCMPHCLITSWSSMFCEGSFPSSTSPLLEANW